MPRALDAIERALEADPNLPEARFNRGLVLERFAREPARRAWEAFLEVENQGGWAEEARLALTRLAEIPNVQPWPEVREDLDVALRSGDRMRAAEIVRYHLEATRSVLVREHLGTWAEAMARGDRPRADRILARATSLAALLTEVSQDELWRQGVLQIATALAPGANRSLLTALVAGLRQLSTGVESFEGARYSEAVAALATAGQTLESVENPFGAWAKTVQLPAIYRSGDPANAARAARQLLDSIEAESYPTVAGRALWVRGTAEFVLGRPAEAQRFYRRSLPYLELAGSAVEQAAMHTRLASVHADFGEKELAWGHRLTALRLLQGHEGEREYALALADAVFGAVELGLPQAALVLQTEALVAERRGTDPTMLSLALRHRGTLLAKLGRTAEAEEALVKAGVQAEQIADSAERRLSEHYLLFEWARAQLRSQPREALARLDQALTSFHTDQTRFLLPEVLYERALAHLELSDIRAADADLEEALRELEGLRTGRDLEAHRAALFDRHDRIFETRIALLTERLGRNDLALDVFEQARARWLLDALGRLFGGPELKDVAALENRTPEPLAILSPRLPPQVVFLVAHLGHESLLVWRLEDGQLTLQQAPSSAERVRHLLRDLDDHGGRHSEALAEEELARLYDLLIRRALSEEDAGKTLVVVPDGPLATVPFGALLNRETGRYLIEDHPLITAPSLNAFSRLSEQIYRLISKSTRIRVIADPAFDPEVFDGLHRLWGAAQEGDVIGSLFGQAEILTDGAATRNALLAGLEDVELLHIAAHSFTRPGSPFQSSLVLAPGPDDDQSGALYAWELLPQHLAGLRLAVLATCRSASSEGSRRDGILGLVWPFLAHAVPVVATVRDVEDSMAADLMATFYRHLSETEEPLLALRHAQLETLGTTRRSPEAALTWGAFQFYGGLPRP